MVKATLRKKHGAERIQNELSALYLGDNVQRAEAALVVFFDPSDWESQYACIAPRDLPQRLLHMAGFVNLRKLRKHPRGPKKPAAKRQVDAKKPHFSTARVLEEANEKRRSAASKKNSSRRD